MGDFYLLTFPRFPLRKKEHKSYFGKNRTHDFRTSMCAGYLLDHSGDEQLIISYRSFCTSIIVHIIINHSTAVVFNGQTNRGGTVSIIIHFYNGRKYSV